jgi:hypothetical protein
MSDTPETDHLVDLDNMQDQRDLAMKVIKRLERERDKMQTELELWRDGNILHEVHRDELEKTERERDEARDEAHRFRSLHYSHLGINGSASWFPWESRKPEK